MPSLPGAHTASADWTLPGRALAQTDDQDEEESVPSLEDRARALFGDQPLRGTLPGNELNQELLFKFLLSEIAGQRGNVQLAAQGYLELAKTTRDPRLARRATELAAFGRLQNLALESAKLWLELDKNNPQARQTVAALLVSSNKLSEAKPLPRGDDHRRRQRRDAGFMQLHSLLGKHPDHKAVLERHQGSGQGLSAAARSPFCGGAGSDRRGQLRSGHLRGQGSAQAQAGLGARRAAQRPDPAGEAIRPQGDRVSAAASSRPIRSRARCVPTMRGC